MKNVFKDMVENFNIQDDESFPIVAPFNNGYCDPQFFEKGKRYPNYTAVNGIYGIFEEGICLYVGQTLNGLANRLKQHYRDNDWCQALIKTGKCELRLLYEFDTARHTIRSVSC